MAPNRTAIALIAVAALAVVGVPFAVGPAGTGQNADAAAESASPSAPEREALVRPGDDGSLLWPYTSASRSVAGRTLAINVVVHGEADRVRRSLTDETDVEWNRTAANESEADAETHSVVVTDEGIAWSGARGSTRYTYVDAGPRGGDGAWVTPDYQLHAGSYLGARRHIRAYEAPRPDDDWTAIQAHGEYWDWFRLRHTVTSVGGAARAVEADFIGEPYVREVRREYRGNRGGGNDGWITAVELAAAALAVGSSVGRGPPSPPKDLRRRSRAALVDHAKKLPLPVSLLALYLGVRTAGVALEGAFPATSPKVFAGALYPVLALGLPVAAARTARPLGRVPAFALAVLGLGAAFVLDFSALGVTAASIRLVLHRIGLLCSVGVVAAGFARADGPGETPLVALGAVGWTLCLLLPLLGVL